jgi:hypothetical protein
MAGMNFHFFRILGFLSQKRPGWPSTQHHLPVGVEPDQDEQHYAEGQQRGSAIAYEWQRDADHWGKANGHTDVDDNVKEKHAGHAIGITPAEDASLSFGYRHDTHQQNDVDAKKQYAAREAKALPDRTKYKIGLLFGHEVVTGLCPLEQSLSDEAAAADGYLTLLNIVIVVAALLPAFLYFVLERRLGGLVFGDIVFTDSIVDTFDLVRLEDMIKCEGDYESLHAYTDKPDTHDKEKNGAIALDRLAQDIDGQDGDARKDERQRIGFQQEGSHHEYGKRKIDQGQSHLMLHDTHSGRDKRDSRCDEMGTGPAEIRFYARQVLRQGEVDEQLTEVGRLQLESAPEADDRFGPFDLRVKRKDQQEQEDAKGIT